MSLPIVGHVLSAVEGLEPGSELVRFVGAGGGMTPTWVMQHSQDCCEDVRVGEVHGDPQDLVGVPILHAEVSSSRHEDEDEWAWSWTFYTFRTIRGTVTVRWVGQGSAYYSQRVDFDVYYSQWVDDFDEEVLS